MSTFNVTWFLLQLLCFRVISAALVETFAEQSAGLDDKVSLRCTATGSPLPMITWTLDGLSLDKRKAVASDQPALRRASWGDYVVFDKGQVVSHVNVTVESVFDGGMFSCTANNSIVSSTHTARLHVPGSTRIRKMDNLSATAGEFVLLPCWQVGDRADNIVWIKDGQRIPFHHRQRVHMNGSLEISALDKTIDSGNYTCLAYSSKKTAKEADDVKIAEQSMQLLVKVPPVIEDFKFDSKLQAGMRTRVYCNVAQGDPPVQLAWAKDGVLIQGNSLAEVYVRQIDEFSLALVIENLSAHHNGNYSCLAANEAASVNHMASLLVNVPPSWRLEPRSLQVMEGSSVNIDCMAQGFPTPQITWKRLIWSGNDEMSLTSQQYQLIRSGPHYQVYENGTLRISKALMADKGGYLCQASNSIGPGLGTMVQLSVNIPARFESLDKHENLTVRKLEFLLLSCQAYGDQPISIEWMRQSDRLAMATERRYVFEEQNTSQGMISRLNISHVSRQESTTFKCTASNAFGSDIKLLHVRVVEVPEAPLDLQLESKSSRNVALRWLAPFNGNSPMIEYIIRVQEEHVEEREVLHPRTRSELRAEKNISVSGNSSSTIVRNLLPARRYVFAVYARNRVGISVASKSLTAITDEEAPGGPPSNVHLIAIDGSSIKVDWLPPRDDLVNGHIKGYYIGYKIANSSKHFVYKTVQPQAHPEGHVYGNAAEGHGELKAADGSDNTRYSMILQGMQPYTQYVVILQAFNSIGAGPRSDELIVTTAESSPSSFPATVECMPLSSQSLKVTWDKLTSDKVNGQLRGYKVQYRLLLASPMHLKDSELSVKSELVREQNRLILNGLLKFANYSIKVAAYNAAGDGLYSPEVTCKTSEDVPGPPESVKVAVAGADALVVSWQQPVDSNGLIRSYTIFRKSALEEPATTFTVPKHFRSYKASGLQKGKRYSFWVTAATQVGEGIATPVVTQSIGEKGMARILEFGESIERLLGETVEMNCQAVGIPEPSIEWHFNGKSIRVAAEKKEISSSGERELRNLELLMNGSLRITGVALEDSGNYSCHAKNMHGSDIISYKLTVVRDKESTIGGSVHLPPTIRVVNATAKSITIEWKSKLSLFSASSASFSAASLLTHEIYFKNLLPASEWKHYVINDNNQSTGTFTINNLGCGSKYQIYAITLSSFGKSSPSEIVTTGTVGREPLASPASVFVTRFDKSSLKLNLNTWRNGGCPLLEGSVQWRAANAKQWTTLAVPSFTDPVMLSGLSSENNYKIRVSMKNAAGTTTVEYEARTAPFKIANVMYKSPSDSSEHTFKVDATNDGVGSGSGVDGSQAQGPLIVTSLVTLILLLAALLSIIVLYKTIQKKFVANGSSSEMIRTASNNQSITKVPFAPNDILVSSADNFGGAELGVLTATLDRDRKNKSKKKPLRTSSSDSAFNGLAMFATTPTREEPAYQYLTVARRMSFPKRNIYHVDEYATVDKRVNDKTTATKEPSSSLLGLGLTSSSLSNTSPRYAKPTGSSFHTPSIVEQQQQSTCIVGSPMEEQCSNLVHQNELKNYGHPSDAHLRCNNSDPQCCSVFKGSEQSDSSQRPTHWMTPIHHPDFEFHMSRHPVHFNTSTKQ